MKWINVVACLMYLAASVSVGESNQVDDVQSNIYVSIGGELSDCSVEVFLMVADEFVSVPTDDKWVLVSTGAEVLRVPAVAGASKIKFVADGLSYIFDISIEPDLLCFFEKAENRVWFSAGKDKDVVGSLVKEREVWVRVLGEIRGQDVQLYSGERLLFSGVIDRESVPLSQNVSFLTSDSPVNIRVVFSGVSSSFDFAPSNGCYLDVYKYQGNNLRFSQYEKKVDVPGLY